MTAVPFHPPRLPGPPLRPLRGQRRPDGRHRALRHPPPPRRPQLRLPGRAPRRGGRLLLLAPRPPLGGGQQQRGRGRPEDEPDLRVPALGVGRLPGGGARPLLAARDGAGGREGGGVGGRAEPADVDAEVEGGHEGEVVNGLD